MTPADLFVLGEESRAGLSKLFLLRSHEAAPRLAPGKQEQILGTEGDCGDGDGSRLSDLLNAFR